MTPTTDLFSARFVERYTQADVDQQRVADALSPAGRWHWEVALSELADAFALSSPRLSDRGKVVDALYETLTGRAPGPARRAYWIDAIATTGAGRLATALRNSTAGRARIVDERYRQILGRAPGPFRRRFWVAELARPDGERRLVTALLESASFLYTASS